MSDKSFSSPVFVRTGPEFIQEIASLNDALDFLDEWPEELRGPVYETALRACCRAHDGHIPVSVGRDAFAGFAKSARILEDITAPLPWMQQRGSGVSGAPAE